VDFSVKNKPWLILQDPLQEAFMSMADFFLLEVSLCQWKHIFRSLSVTRRDVYPLSCYIGVGFIIYILDLGISGQTVRPAAVRDRVSIPLSTSDLLTDDIW